MTKTATGIILAGGLARRLDHADKAMVEVAGQPLLAHVKARLAPQCISLAINANGDPSRFNRFALPVIADGIAGFPGPLAGVLAGMEWTAKNHPNEKWLVTLPVDTPFFPTDLVKKLLTAIENEKADMACASSNKRAHPVIGAWPVHLAGDLRKALIEDNIRKVDLWTANYKLSTVEFETSRFDPFFNINRPEDITRAQEVYAIKVQRNNQAATRENT